MSDHPAYSADYRTGRDRFRTASRARGFRLQTITIDERADLTIDVAFAGAERPDRLVIVSSGLHGVEGFLGSAVQNSLLEDPAEAWPLPDDAGLILIHALNPWGYANLRRFDEANVDLNRNFLLEGQAYSGTPEIYRELDGLLNPPGPPRLLDLMAIESIPALWRHGERALRRAIARGQYDFPRGLFYGGAEPSRVHRVLLDAYPRWIGGATQILQLDIHTGLGGWGELVLLLEDTVSAERARWLADQFAGIKVEWSGEGIAYPTRGGLGTWCQATFSDRAFDYCCAEFGTYSGRTNLSALRAENQAFHWGPSESRSTVRARRRLVEAFAPADRSWRAETLERGRDAVRRSFAIVLQRGGIG